MQIKNTINTFEAYMSMLNFLEEIYAKNNGDDLGSILGSMDINYKDGFPMDKVFKKDWLNAVKVTVPENTKEFTSTENFSIMLAFLRDLLTRINSIEITELLNHLKLNENQSNVQDEWNLAIKKTLTHFRW